MRSFNQNRRRTVQVRVGDVMMGSDWPVRVQSMTNTSTDDVPASVAQCQRIAAAGGEIVRLTAQGVREAENVGHIREQLRSLGCQVPLVADIHFNPRAAFAAAQVCDKVRINPGNFVDPARQFKSLSYTDEQYAAELRRIAEALTPFIALCREHHTAVRLGVNHGSLSDRIMSRYGNTAAGMVESVMEYLRVFVAQQFTDVVISMKASNVVVMVEAVRRLVAAMDAEQMHFPLHLGVTEAGFGDDGRVKSAVGIGTLMAEGLGDTVRVSLSEEPEAEIPVARKLVSYMASQQGHKPIEGEPYDGYDALVPQRRPTVAVAGLVGGRELPVVIASCSPAQVQGMNVKPDFYYSESGDTATGQRYIVPAAKWQGREGTSPLFTSLAECLACAAPMKWLQVPASTPASALEGLRGRTDVVLVATPDNACPSACLQAFMHRLTTAGIQAPCVVRCTYPDTDAEWLQVKAGADMGTVLMNGCRDGLWLEAPAYDRQADLPEWAFAIMQAARLRMSRTEFISCPGCGRTMFDLQDTVRRVKAATAHLTHLKIGVMGCVVNGPGEMADADYGYVGASRDRISLYKGKQCIEKNIPEADAIPRLVALIKQNGDWRDP